MKYENTKRKLRKNWEDSQVHENQTLEEETRVEIIKNDFIEYPYNNAKTIHSYSTEWEEIEANTDLGSNTFLKQWQITINRININLLPFIEFKVLYQKPDNITFEALYKGAFKKIAHIFRVIDLEEENLSENIKKVILVVHAGLVQDVDFPENVIQIKLLINIFNPEFYI